MNNLSKLPYKTKFEPEYEQLQQRIAKLPIPPAASSSYQVSDQLIQVFNNAKQKIRQQDLEFAPSTIYSQYASPKQMNENKKKASQFCPGCGDEGKKQVQCEFCAIVYCKNCCSRKRVLPNLSDPKDSKAQCEECHTKFVKLFANQKFYHESALLQKIIEGSNTKLKKIEKQALGKKQRLQAVEKKKKQGKIRQNMLLKQLKNEEKKIQDLQQKLQQVVKKKAQSIRQQQQKLEEEKKKQQEREKQQSLKIKQQQQKLSAQRERQQAQAQRLERERQMQQQIREAQKRQKQIEAQKQQFKKKQEETQKQLKKQWLEMELLKQKDKQKQQKRKQEQEEIRKQQIERIKKAQSEEDHRREADELKNLASALISKPETLVDENQGRKAPVALMGATTPSKNVANGNSEASSPLMTFSSPAQNKQSVNSSFQHVQQITPKKSQPSNALQKQLDNQKPKLMSTSNMSEDLVTTSLNAPTIKTQHSDKIQQTEGTEKGTDNQEEDPKSKSSSVQNNESDEVLTAFNALPQIAINVSQMTVTQLLGIHVNPNVPKSPTKRKSQRQSYSKQQRPADFRNSIEEYRNSLPEENDQNKITQQEKQNILRSSNMNSSLIHSHEPEELYEHPDPSGSKCNCNIM